jgi:2-succinyl-6-hydroxy-2,4-cyclohexadiene-1-carboxylate synthase
MQISPSTAAPYRLSGQGKQPLLLLHGFTGSSQDWEPILPLLTAASPAITVDLLGHGRAAAPNDPTHYRMETAAADLATLINEISTPPVDLIGYSMGGRLALYLAVHYPQLIRRLIVESASPGLASAAERQARRQQDKALADWLEENGVTAFVDRWEKLPLWASQAQLEPEKQAWLRHQRLQNNPVGLANSLRGMGSGVQPNLWPHLTQLDRPALLIVGERDQKFVAINQAMAAQMPQAKLAVVANAGHTVHLERPLAYVHLCNTFLNSGL